ncbi:hypothetical protein LXL04_018778 [Taraxacum kok-saghyz]
MGYSMATMTSANQWSVGCTVIEMATGKPPWSQQYQVMFCLGCCSFSYRNRTTKAHPPIPYHLSMPLKRRNWCIGCFKCSSFEHNLRFEAYVGDIIPYALELIQLLIVKSIYKVFCKFSF